MLHERFYRTSLRYPDAYALMIGDQSITYRELDLKARRIAVEISSTGMSPGRVGVFGSRSEGVYAAILGVLYAGGTFVPLNPAFPAGRTRTMIQLAALDTVIVDPSFLQAFTEIASALEVQPRVIVSDQCVHADADPASSIRFPVSDRNEGDAAYLLFTSGSSGIPKGVEITHSNVEHFLEYNQSRYSIVPSDRLTQNFDLTFDLSVFDLFMAWSAGACVCVPKALELLAPFRFIEKKGITVWFSVPSVASLLLKKNLLTPRSLPSLRLSLFCGEALPVAVAAAWQEAAPQAVLENLYGPTELTIACSTYRWIPGISEGESSNGTVPIGKVYPGMQFKIVDSYGSPVQDGEEGELCVTGPQMFQGYLNSPEISQRAFHLAPGPEGTTTRYYRTGDRVRLASSGDLHYLGRNDSQVKVNGYRVELGEVECALRRIPGVVDAVALGWPERTGNVSGIVAVVSGTSIGQSHANGMLRAHLPTYMLPRQVHWTEAMPLNSNGKIDRNAIRDLLERPGLAVSAHHNELARTANC